MENNEKSKNENKCYKTASTIFDFMIYSEDAKEREEAKNDMIEFYKSSFECKKAVIDTYKKKKKDLEGLENSEEYKRLLEIGSILEFEKKHNNSIEDFSSCSEELDNCCNTGKCCLIA